MLARLGATARRAFGAVLLVSTLALFASLLGQSRTLPERHWTFLDGTELPADLAVRNGPWSMEEDDTATGAHALVSREGSAPAVIVVPSLVLRDLTAVTRCKGDCGVVFRYRGETHYEVARIDTTTREVVLASVVGGKEHVLVRAAAYTTPDAWNELRVDASATIIRVTVNGRRLIEASEGAYATNGLVGLWAPSSVAYFDALSIGALPDSLRALELLPILARPRG